MLLRTIKHIIMNKIQLSGVTIDFTNYDPSGKSMSGMVKLIGLTSPLKTDYDVCLECIEVNDGDIWVYHEGSKDMFHGIGIEHLSNKVVTCNIRISYSLYQIPRADWIEVWNESANDNEPR